MITLLFGLVITFLVHKELEYRKYIRNIIDTQHDVLIVTDGKKIKDANQAFLNFFKINSLNQFKVNGSNCICDYFSKSDKYIQKEVNGLWN